MKKTPDFPFVRLGIFGIVDLVESRKFCRVEAIVE
jgi:hypothetical protein